MTDEVTTTTECPPLSELQLLMHGRCTEARSSALCEHVGACPACQKRLDSLAGGEPEIAEHLREATREAPAQNSAYWRALRDAEDDPAVGVDPERDVAAPVGHRGQRVADQRVGSGEQVGRDHGRQHALDRRRSSAISTARPHIAGCIAVLIRIRAYPRVSRVPQRRPDAVSSGGDGADVFGRPVDRCRDRESFPVSLPRR